MRDARLIAMLSGLILGVAISLLVSYSMPVERRSESVEVKQVTIAGERTAPTPAILSRAELTRMNLIADVVSLSVWALIAGAFVFLVARTLIR